MCDQPFTYFIEKPTKISNRESPNNKKKEKDSEWQI